MPYNNYKLITLIILVLSFSITIAPNAIGNPLPSQAVSEQNKVVLAGVVIGHGMIIDAIQPIYRKINEDGSLGESIKGNQYGGNGGASTEVYKNNFVVVGFIYSIGMWMGEGRIAGLYTILQEWKNGKPSGDRIIFGPFGDVNELSYDKIPYIKIYNQGIYVSDLQVRTTEQFVSNINIFVAGKKEVVQSEPKPKSVNLPYDPKDIYYKFDINIVSGTKAGNTVQGVVSFQSDAPNEFASANRFVMRYMGSCYEMGDLDGNPSGKFDGVGFSKLAFTGGPNNNRFGLNTGFSRYQFGRVNESFVRNGEEYFGYLQPNTIVDGVGTVKYERLDDNNKSLYNSLLCNQPK